LAVRRHLVFDFHSGEFGFFPAAAALFQGAVEEDGGGLVGAALLLGELGFGGDEAAFDGGLEHRRAIAFQVRLDPLEPVRRSVETREVGIEPLNNPTLFHERRNRDDVLLDVLRRQIRLRGSIVILPDEGLSNWTRKKEVHVVHNHVLRRSNDQKRRCDGAGAQIRNNGSLSQRPSKAIQNIAWKDLPATQEGESPLTDVVHLG